MAAKPGSTISASLIIVVLVASVVGAIVAIVLQDTGLGSRTIALIAGFLATIAASVARYKVIFSGAGRGPNESKMPSVVVIYSAIASVAGSLAAHDLHRSLSGELGAGFLGALAGLFSAILMAMLMIVYHRNPIDRRN